MKPVTVIWSVIVGHENEDTYSTASGRHELVQAAGFCRLAIVTLYRGHVYQDMDEIKGDLNAAMMQFAPKDLKSQVFIFTVGYESQKFYSGNSYLHKIEILASV